MHVKNSGNEKQPSRVIDFFTESHFFTELQIAALRLDTLIDVCKNGPFSQQ